MMSALSVLARSSHARLLCVSVALWGCSDVTAPRPLDPDAVARVIPAVHDARTRITRGIEDSRVARALRLEILGLETALLAGDETESLLRSDVVAAITVEYAEHIGPGAADGAEVSAIQLMLIAVRRTLGWTT